MEPEQTEDVIEMAEREAWHSPLCRPTKLSKALALILFFVLPMFGYWTGQTYTERVIQLESANSHVPFEAKVLKIETEELSE